MKAESLTTSEMPQSVELIGATSPLGLALLERLKLANHSVTACYRSANLIDASSRQDRSTEFRRLDLEEPFVLSNSPNTVIWLAHLDTGRRDGTEIAGNIAALDRYLTQLDPSLTRKIVFVSSGGSVYGQTADLPIVEDTERRPLSSYGQAKRAMEDRLLDFGARTGIAIAMLRPGNIYGFEHPERRCKGVIKAFLRAIVEDSEFTLVHDGETVRDFVHVADVCQAVMLAVESERHEIVWNVATGVGTRTIDVLLTILELSGKPMPIVQRVENYPTDVLANVLSIDRIYEECGWKPVTNLSEGLRSMLSSWFESVSEASASSAGRSGQRVKPL